MDATMDVPHRRASHRRVCAAPGLTGGRSAALAACLTALAVLAGSLVGLGGPATTPATAPAGTPAPWTTVAIADRVGAADPLVAVDAVDLTGTGGPVRVPGSGAPGDFARIPDSCATAEERVPQEALVCYLTEFRADRPTVVLWGDSHAWMLVPALEQASRGRDVNLVLSTFGGCPAMDPGLTEDDLTRLGRCGLNAYLGLRLVEQLQAGDQPLKVVVAGNWEMYERAIAMADAGRGPGTGRASYAFAQAEIFRDGGPLLARELAGWGVDVDVVAQVPRPPRHPGPCAEGRDPYRCAVVRRDAFFDERSTTTWVRSVFAPVLARGARMIDLSEALCSPYLCRGWVDGVATYSDNSHLTASMARLLTPYLEPSVADVAPRTGGPGSTGSTEPPGAGSTPGACVGVVFC